VEPIRPYNTEQQQAPGYKVARHNRNATKWCVALFHSTMLCDFWSLQHLTTWRTETLQNVVLRFFIQLHFVTREFFKELLHEAEGCSTIANQDLRSTKTWITNTYLSIAAWLWLRVPVLSKFLCHFVWGTRMKYASNMASPSQLLTNINTPLQNENGRARLQNATKWFCDEFLWHVLARIGNSAATPTGNPR